MKLKKYCSAHALILGYKHEQVQNNEQLPRDHETLHISVLYIEYIPQHYNWHSHSCIDLVLIYLCIMYTFSKERESV